MDENDIDAMLWSLAADCPSLRDELLALCVAEAREDFSERLTYGNTGTYDDRE